MNILLHGQASAGFRRQIDAIFGAGSVAIVEEASGPALDTALAEVEALLHILIPITPAMIEAAPRLRLIQKLGVGVNTIALDAAAAKGVAVCNMPGTNSQAVAESALALMLAVLRRTPYFDTLTRSGAGWRPDPAILDTVGEVSGRTVGLVGYGNSAQRLATALAALGARVIYTARGPHAGSDHDFRTLPALFAEADIVSLHVPLTDATRGMIDAAALAAMKPGAILINTARGELVDEAAIVAALRSGHLRGAGLDVFADEPVGAGHPLFALPQVVLSPHIAWLTPETLARSLAVAHENCRRLAAGEPLLHQVT